MKTKAAVPAAAIFKAMSDRTRLRVLNLLRGGELCVCDLVDLIGVPQPKVSRHLAYLRRTGLVVARKEGLWIHYSLAKAESTFRKSLMQCLADCAAEMPELASDTARLSRKGLRTC